KRCPRPFSPDLPLTIRCNSAPLSHVEMTVATMIGCTGSVGRGLFLQPILSTERASHPHDGRCAASISNRGLSLIDLRSASDGTTSKLSGFQESRAVHN